MKILSLFDGISIAQQALKNCGIEVEKYYASEIDKYAISITQKNFPNTIQLGSVTDIKGEDFKDIDLIIGGSPCQDLSIAKKNREGLSGSRSGLFYEYVRILNEVKPKYFILENVNSMPKEAKEVITKELFGIEPVMINAALVSAQNRKRLFWVGKLIGDTYERVEIPQPKDEGILLKDILESDVDEKYYVKVNEKYGLKGLCTDSEKSKSMTASMHKGYGNDGETTVRIGYLNQGGQGDRIYSPDGKSVNLSANSGGHGDKTGLYAINKPIILGDEKLQVLKEGRTELGKQSRREIRQKTGADSTSRSSGYKAYYGREGLKSNCITTGLGAEGMVVEDYQIRKLTPIECERLQSLPDNYTEGVSNTQRYKALGNGFNCAVIEHILKYFK